MPDYVTLIGAEDVSRAGRQMASAAEDFGRHAQTLDFTMTSFLRSLDERLGRLEAMLAAHAGRMAEAPQDAASTE